MKLPSAFVIPVALIASTAHAQNREKIQAGATLDYAFPAGGLERGSRVSDLTYGLAELTLDGAYRLHPRLLAGLALHYGAAVPTLCTTSADCVSSLGHDVRLAALGRWQPLEWRSLEPSLDLELGYEWFESKLTDSGVTSSRSYRGWFVGLSAYGGFRLSQRWTLGPVVASSLGIFEHVALNAPGVTTSQPTDGNLIHAWFVVGARVVSKW